MMTGCLEDDGFEMMVQDNHGDYDKTNPRGGGKKRADARMPMLVLESDEPKEVSNRAEHPSRLQEGFQVQTFHLEVCRGFQVLVSAGVSAPVFRLQVFDQKLLNFVFHLG